MHKLAAPMAGAGLLLVVAVGAVAAAAPAPSASVSPAPAATVAPAATPAPVADANPIAAILGLTDEEVAALRHDGLSLAQIAERQKVDPQRLIDALVAQWSVRIDARLAAGAITADQAETLKANLAVLAKAMVNQTALGGMRGAAVGAGPNNAGNGAGRGAGAGAGPRDGAGAAGGRGPGARMGADADGSGRGGVMRGAGNGTGICPMADTAPSS